MRLELSESKQPSPDCHGRRPSSMLAQANLLSIIRSVLVDLPLRSSLESALRFGYSSDLSGPTQNVRFRSRG